jgi:glucan phosphoethanolaminetransferase (alkaline phosphatase superfamily)
MIANALDSVGHISDVIDYKLFLYFLFFTIIPSIILLKIKLQKTNFFIKISSLFCISILILILVLSMPKNTPTFAINAISPSSYLSASYRYYKRFRVAQKIAKNRQSLTNFYKFEYDNKINNNEQDELKIIVVMGESLRSDHLQIFGYDRQTTPNLSKINNLLKFRSQAFFTHFFSRVDLLTQIAVNCAVCVLARSLEVDIQKEFVCINSISFSFFFL